MVYVEYNTTKKRENDFEVGITESNTQQDHMLLPFAPISNIRPNENIYPSGNMGSVDIDYLLRFAPTKTYPYGKYCFKYDNKYYLFERNIRKDETLYFRFAEYYDDEDNLITEPELLGKGSFQGKEILQVYDVLELNKSGSETTFSTVKADFGIRGMEQLPMAFQEIRIWKGELIGEDDLSECKLIYTGYLDNAQLTQKHTSDDECDIEISLISPKNIATKRSVSINGTYSIKNALNIIFQPLINDGFKLKEVNIDDRNISVNYFLETIETIMNDFSNQYNLFWTIDSNKNIFVNNIIKLLGKNPKMIINDEEDIEGLYELRPTIKNNNYFNTINVKNARIFTTAYDKEILEIMKLIKDKTMTFVNPIDFGINSCKRVCENNNKSTCTLLSIYDDDGNILYDVSYEVGDKNITLPSEMVWDDGDTEDATIILKRDSFFKTLVTGIEWKGATQKVYNIKTDTMLKYQVFRFTNSNEINKCSQFLTNSGIIETTIDVNEGWFTYNEMVEYCNNMMTANSNNVVSVELSIDKDYNLDVGDTIRINKPDFFIVGDFIITEIKEQISGFDNYDCHITAQNSQIQENYIDIFRKQKKEENEVKYQNTNIIEYISEEVIENYGIYVEGGDDSEGS